MVSAQLLALVKRFEGCILEAYQDQGGIWTIGYGSTGPNIKQGVVWTLSQAENALESALEHDLEAIRKMVLVAITDNQLDALCSFAYNCGLYALDHSHLLIKLNNGDKVGAAAEFLRWDEVDGKPNPGLLKRREEEKALFLS